MNQFLEWVKHIVPVTFAIIGLVLSLAAFLTAYFRKRNLWSKLSPPGDKERRKKVLVGESVLEYLGNVDVKDSPGGKYPTGEKK